MNRTLKILTGLACAAAIATVAFGCEDDDDSKKEYDYCSGPATTPLFTPGVADDYNPWPSNNFSVQDPNTVTGRRLNIGANSFMLFNTDVNLLDGFSTWGAGYFTFDLPIDPRGFPKDVRTDNWQASPLMLFALGDEGIELMPIEVTVSTNHREIFWRPIYPLAEGVDHALVLLRDRGVKGEIYECTDTPEAMRPLLRGEEIRGATTPDLNARYNKWFKALAASDFDVSKDDLLLLYEFTTQTFTHQILDVRDFAQQHAGDFYWEWFNVYRPLNDEGIADESWWSWQPPLPEDITVGGDSLVDPPFENIAWVVYAGYNTFDFRNELGYYDWIGPHGGGGPIPYTTGATVEVLITVPDIDKVHPLVAPLLGNPPKFPVVIFGHGIGVCKETLLSEANAFAHFGFVTMGIDVDGHGSRSRGGRACEADIFGTFVDITTFLTFRDNFRMTSFEQIQLLAMLQNLSDEEFDILPKGDTNDDGILEPVGDGVIDIDTSFFAYTGQSLGSIQGAVFVGVTPEIKASVLNVGGAGLIDFAAAAGFIQDYMDIENMNHGLLRTLSSAQMLVDAADPINYAWHIFYDPLDIEGNGPRNVLEQEAIEDSVVPNHTSNQLVKSLRAVQQKPVTYYFPYAEIVDEVYQGEVATCAARQYDFDQNYYGNGEREHFLLGISANPMHKDASQLQAAIFMLSSFLSDGGPSLAIDPYNYDIENLPLEP